jgi:hypothetical protein
MYSPQHHHLYKHGGRNKKTHRQKRDTINKILNTAFRNTFVSFYNTYRCHFGSISPSYTYLLRQKYEKGQTPAASASKL